jgi:hypothetical protein
MNFFKLDCNDNPFLQPGSDGTWAPPQLAFDLSTAGLHTLIPTIHPAHLSVRNIFIFIIK